MQVGALKAQKSTRSKKKEARSEASSARRINDSWEIRKAQEEAGTECLYRQDVKVFCRYGGIREAFVSSDGARLVCYASGRIEPFHTKGLFIFDARSGKQLKDVELSGGGSLYGTWDSVANRFFALHEDGRTMLLESYDSDGNQLWQRRFADLRASSGPGPQSLVLGADGRTILVAGIDPRGKGGRVFVLSADGESLQDMSMKAPRLISASKAELGVAWNRSSVLAYSFSRRKVMLEHKIEAGDPQGVVVQAISPDSRFIVLTAQEGRDRKTGTLTERPRLKKVEVLDMLKERVLREEINEELSGPVHVRFLAADSFVIESEEKEIAYDGVQ